MTLKWATTPPRHDWSKDRRHTHRAELHPVTVEITPGSDANWSPIWKLDVRLKMGEYELSDMKRFAKLSDAKAAAEDFAKKATAAPAK